MDLPFYYNICIGIWMRVSDMLFEVILTGKLLSFALLINGFTARWQRAVIPIGTICVRYVMNRPFVSVEIT